MSEAGFECGLDLVPRARASGGTVRWQPPVFDREEASPTGRPGPGPTPLPLSDRALHFDEDELARLLAAACARRQREMEAAFRAEENRRLSAAVEAVHARLGEALRRLADALRESRAAVVDLLAEALRRAVPALLERLEEAEVRRVLAAWSRRALPEETLVVRVRPQVRDALAAADSRGGGDLRFEFVGDPALPPGGVELELPRGRARHDPERLVAELVAALCALLEDGGAGTDRPVSTSEEGA